MCSGAIRICILRVLLIGFAILYIGFIHPPPGDLRQGLDPSIRLGINIFDRYDLEFGTDLVHVYGPLGRLIFPVAGNGRLFHACLFALFIHTIFISLLVIFGFTARNAGSLIFFGVVFLFYSHFNTFKIRESHLIGIPLFCYLVAVEKRLIWWSVVGALMSGFFVLLKFNVAVSLFTLLLVFILITFVFRYFSPKSLLMVSGIYVATGAITASSTFSSIHSFTTWVSRSWRVAAGNSEIMSRSGNQIELLVALIILALIPVTAAINSRRYSTQAAITWAALVGVPAFFEFKHGFVRAGSHILFFFGFAPLIASSAVLMFPNRRTWIPVVSILVLCSFGSGIAYTAMVPWEWRHGLDFSLIRSITRGKRADTTTEMLYHRRICRSALDRAEIKTIGSSGVDLLPFDITPLLCGRMAWNPAPFFQQFLIRDAYSDSVNAAHYESSRAAEYILFRWNVLDAVHPLYWCPVTHRSIYSNYRPVLLSNNRILLRRSSPREIETVSLGTVNARFDEQVAIPESEYPVIAKVHLRYHAWGNLIKALYRAPPVFIQFNDGYVSRIVPGTAPNGILCNFIPRIVDQLMDYYAGMSYRPTCPRTSGFRIYMDESLSVFRDDIHIEFQELRVRIDSPGPARFDS